MNDLLYTDLQEISRGFKFDRRQSFDVSVWFRSDATQRHRNDLGSVRVRKYKTGTDESIIFSS